MYRVDGKFGKIEKNTEIKLFNIDSFIKYFKAKLNKNITPEANVSYIGPYKHISGYSFLLLEPPEDM